MERWSGRLMRSARNELRPDRLPEATAAEPNARPRKPSYGVLLDDDDLQVKRIIQAKQREQAERLERFDQPEPVEQMRALKAVIIPLAVVFCLVIGRRLIGFL
jgi:hypothetical protein